MEHTIFGLIKKRGEIAGQHKVALKAADTIKADLDALNRALALCGYEDDPKGIAPRGKYKQLFGRNELKLTIITMLRQCRAFLHPFCAPECPHWLVVEVSSRLFKTTR